MFLNAIKQAASVLPPSDIKDFIDIEELFSQLDYEDHVIDVDNGLTGTDDTATDILNNFRYVYSNHLTEILRRHGVYLTEEMEITLPYLKGFTTALIALTSEVDMDLGSTINDDMTPEEALSKIISEIDGPNEFLSLERIDNVDPNLIDLVMSLHKEEEPAVESDRYVKRYLKYSKGRNVGPAYNLIATRNLLPMDFKSALNIIKSEIDIHHSNDSTIYEIVSLLAVSTEIDELDVSDILIIVDEIILPEIMMKISHQLQIEIKAMQNE